MQLIPVLLVGCAAAVVAQLPPRLEVPGSEPVQPQPRLQPYRRPAGPQRGFPDQQFQPLQPLQQPEQRVIRVRRPTARGRHVAPQQPQPQPQQPKQDYISLTPRPVSEDPDSDFDAPAPPPPTRRRPASPVQVAPPAPTPSPARRPVLFRPERVNQVSPSPAPNVHVHQLLREDDDYVPVARPAPKPAVRPQAVPQAQPRPVVRPRPQGNPGGSKFQREKKPVAQVLRRYREDNPDGSITWGYENDDGSFKEETIGVDCMVRGKYGYIDPDGNRREYTYQSGIPCTPAPAGQAQPDDQEGGYIDYQNNQYVLPNGQAINLDDMVKNRKRKPVGKNRNFA